MDTIQKKSFSLEGARVGLSFNELLEKLRKRYPRAYDLRNSIKKSIPVWLGSNHGIVYEILQDNTDGYPKVHYVLWSKDNLFQIYVSRSKADYVGGEGLFFIENGTKHYEKGVRQYPLFRTVGNGPVEDVDNSDSTHFGIPSRWMHVSEGEKHLVEVIKSIIVTRFGLYVLCKGYEGKKVVCFVSNNGGSDSFTSNQFRLLHFPSWMQSWQPGQQYDETFFCDETTIYTLMHSSVSKVKTTYQPDDPDIRFGKTHRWKYSWMSGNSMFIIIESDGRSAFLSKSVFINDSRVNFKQDDRWCFIGEGFLTIEYAASDNLCVTHHIRAKHSWSGEKIFETKLQYASTQMVQMNSNACFIGINGEWFLITNEML